MNWASVVWLILAVGLGVIEAMTVNMVSVWFAIGAFAAMLTSAVTPSITVQIAVFALISASLLLITRKFKDKINIKGVATNADTNIGRKAVVICEATSMTSARVHLDGVDWNAKCDTPLVVGEECTVTKIEGATLVVVPVIK